MASSPDRFLKMAVVALAALLAAAAVVLVLDRRDDRQPLEISFGEPTPGGPIQVYITGAVAQPGVYEMADGDRVVDVLYEAGGQAPDADLEAINLAQRLHDEDRIVVPRQGQAASGSTSSVAGVGVAPTPVNINTATAAELDALPGIGEAYSQRIVESRTNNGPFETTDDLIIRRLVPRATFEKIRELITVGP